MSEGGKRMRRRRKRLWWRGQGRRRGGVGTSFKWLDGRETGQL